MSSSLTINTPTRLVTCEVTAITFSGGTPPYFISIYPGGSTVNPYIQFPAIQASPLDWTVNLTAGTAVTIGIVDSAGGNNADQQVTISAGPDTSCVGSATNTTSGSSSSGAGTSPSSSAGGSSPSSSSETKPSSSSSGTSSSPSTSTSSKGSGAGMVRAGLVTLALGALGVVASFA